MRKLLAALPLLALLVPPMAVTGQVVGVGTRVESYALGNAEELRVSSIRLLSFPFDVRAALAPWVGVSVAGAYADARATLANGEDASVSGPVDTRVSVELRAGGARLTASALVPTGQVVESTEAATVVGLLSTDLMPFSVTQWGTGGGLGADLAYRLRPGRAAIELSLGGTVLSESTVLSGGPATYRPGREVRARASVETGVGSAGVFQVLAGFQDFDGDTYGDDDVYLPGYRVQGLASLAFPLRAGASVMGYGAVYHLGSGDFPAETPAVPLGQVPLAGTRQHPARTLVVVGSEMRLRLGSLTVAPNGDVRVLRNADGVGQGWLVSIGSSAGLRTLRSVSADGVVVEPGLDLHFGRLVANDGIRSSIVGARVSVSLRWGAAP